jgi:hypothetical protein
MPEECQQPKLYLESDKGKAAGRRLFKPTRMIADQAAIKAGFDFRR